jgi:hypothetical protein
LRTETLSVNGSAGLTLFGLRMALTAESRSAADASIRMPPVKKSSSWPCAFGITKWSAYVPLCAFVTSIVCVTGTSGALVPSRVVCVRTLVEESGFGARRLIGDVTVAPVRRLKSRS